MRTPARCNYDMIRRPVTCATATATIDANAAALQPHDIRISETSRVMTSRRVNYSE